MRHKLSCTRCRLSGGVCIISCPSVNHARIPVTLFPTGVRLMGLVSFLFEYRIFFIIGYGATARETDYVNPRRLAQNWG